MEPSNSQNIGLNWKRALLVFVSIVLAVIAWVYVSSPLIVTVTGSGEASVPATNVTLSFTVSATDASIAGAVNSVTAKADAMRKYLIGRGIAESDIAESQVTAVPASLVINGASGFQASISMAAKTVHVPEVAGLVSDLYSNGAFVVAQPILSVENRDVLSQAAFDIALGDAKSQAARIGNKNWKFVRKIVSISQVSSPSTSTSTTKADTLTAADAQASANGVFKIVSAVSVTYKMW